MMYLWKKLLNFKLKHPQLTLSEYIFIGMKKKLNMNKAFTHPALIIYMYLQTDDCTWELFEKSGKTQFWPNILKQEINILGMKNRIIKINQIKIGIWLAPL